MHIWLIAFLLLVLIALAGGWTYRDAYGPAWAFSPLWLLLALLLILVLTGVV